MSGLASKFTQKVCDKKSYISDATGLNYHVKRLKKKTASMAWLEVFP